MTTADKIRALPIPAYLSPEVAFGFACGRDAAAALVEAAPQAVRVKPLVWTDVGDGWKTAAGLGCEYWVEPGEDTSPQQAHYEARILAAIELTPTTVDATDGETA